MKNWFRERRERMRERMSMCYGNDELNRLLNWICVLFCILSFIPKMYFLIFFAFGIMIYTSFRGFSKNKYKRQDELDKYLRLKAGFVKQWRFRRLVFKERKDFVYFKCPKCRAILRVPRHRGEIIVTCRECKAKFDKKT